jgi:hypothetical protein
VRALVVVESVFGNTRRIAEAVAEGLGGDGGEVRLVDVGEAARVPGLLDGVDLLVVGGPTHAFGLTRPATRRSAAEQAGGGAVAAATGLREWLDALPPVAPGTRAAAFDTRVDRPRLPGSAAAGAARRLRRRGVALAAGPESFRVRDTRGPLLPGEPERAGAWGRALATPAGRARGPASVWAAWLLGWLGMVVLALLNGTLRAVVVQPLLGEPVARALATLLLLAALGAWAWWLHRRHPLPGPRTAWAVGAAWVGLTLAFEFGFGRFVEGLDWSTMLADYDLTAGRIWVLVPLATLVLPEVVRRLQERRAGAGRPAALTGAGPTPPRPRPR